MLRKNIAALRTRILIATLFLLSGASKLAAATIDMAR
jgi:hypothetical protein